jgi:GT2 family glycosyltransferase
MFQGAATVPSPLPAHRGTPRLAAVVVTYNRLEQLRLTVTRLLSERVDHVLVVDNASTDGTATWLAGVGDPRLDILRLPVNGGGAGGFEHGLRAAMQRFDPDWCVVMDDDARPAPSTFARFLGEAPGLEAKGWEAVAAAVYYPDGSVCEMNRPSRNPFWDARSFARTALGRGRMGFHIPDTAYRSDATQPIDAASFVGLFLSRAAIRRAGYPDGKLFIYGDDVLYTLSLSRAGGAIGFAPRFAFEHDCSTLESGGVRTHRPLWKVYYNYRNGLLAYRAAAGRAMFWPVLAVVLPKWMARARAYGADRGTYLRLLSLAVRDALANRRDRPHDEILRRAGAPAVPPVRAARSPAN